MATQVASPIDGNKLGDIKPIGLMTPGDITPIPDAEHNDYIIYLARWAIDEYNKEHNATSILKFKKVYCAFKQEVPGVYDIMYSIILEADDGGRMGVYAATVSAQSRQIPPRKLVDFRKIFPPA
ncbi:hypothetical protein BUALT_Bualt12G0028900 [Buddleja alternifolia]|uniref:Cysteine proteinase inhibitor n=1 Tax=Buddleja alternifolia TaxID=168488 RepID=A0AAV6WYT0_9LAMI|nr:hypothetical protein BUALT_Bualt12G0028800 [Buddleja alternifolia]KAG8372076.1 hypothetical protein BUALT_Bualt12G0028900 [Buddleja alternifolia]